MAPIRPKIDSTFGLPDENPFASGKASSKKPPQRKQNIVKSGNANSSTKPVLAPGEEAPPPPLFPVGYKTPLSLLTERCQKTDFWEKPSVDPKKSATGQWTASVTLRRKHPKTGVSESVYMRPPPPPSPIAVEKATAMEAKHFAAIYALFRFANNLRLNLQLPPQTRDYWAALEAEKKASPPNKAWLWSLTPFETASSALSGAGTANGHSAAGSGGVSASNSRNGSTLSSVIGTPSSSRSSTPGPGQIADGSKGSVGPLSKWWQEAPEVRMPTHLRDLVEETIRSTMTQFPNIDLASELSNVAIDEHGPESSLLGSTTTDEVLAMEELISMGFRPGHVSNASNYIRSARLQFAAKSSSPDKFDPMLAAMVELPFKVAILEYLHLHTPEEDLPDSFRSSKPPDATARIATSKDSDALANLWKAEALSREVGMPLVVVEAALADAKMSQGLAIDLMIRRLMGWTVDNVEEDPRMSDSIVLKNMERKISGVEKAKLLERRTDELVGLEGIFGDRFRKTADGLEIIVSSINKRKQGSTNDQVILRVLLHEDSLYPSSSTNEASANPHLPTFYVYSSTLPTYIRLHLTALVASNFSSSSEANWTELSREGCGGVVCEMATFLSDVWQEVVENPPDSRGVLSKLNGSRLHIAAGRKEAAPPGKQPARSSGKSYRPPSSPETHRTLLEHFKKTECLPGYQKMLETRSKLPAWSMRETVVKLINNSRVTIISGETGSGKTTQVPTFVLDDAISRGEGGTINMVVTQPRRVSAIGVATRVAQERLEDINEPSSRDLVGYAIRGERKAARNCRLLFCTTGVILSRLSRGGDPNLDGVSHIFIDEVHERSVDSDFLLLELRDILKRNKKIKVVLMSATINQAQFSTYFGGAPCLEIPGFTHPVIDHYLEEILPNLPHFQTSVKPAKKANQDQLNYMRETFLRRGVTNDRTLMTLELLTRSERIDYNLVGATTAYCLERSKGTEGGVLVFCPGVMEIKQAIEAIRSAVPSSEPIEIFPLHANLSSAEQTSVFRPAKRGHRKVVVATNVAETSITIDGIVYVIDCGRVKENTFDPETGIVRLVETWTSKAASRQRRGRAGRTRPGECFKLFTHYTEETVMANHPTPEIVRIPLESLCLQIKAMREDEDVKSFLGKALNPPDVRAIDSAWEVLRLLGAIEAEGGTAARLTPLGAHLAMIPVDLRLGKMLILAAIFKCLDPILTVVALLSSKPFFLNPMEKREEAKKARSMFYSSRSDLLSDVKAFEGCLAARSHSNGDLRIYAEENFISLSTFRDVLTLRNEYLTALSDVGFVPFRASSSSPSLNANAGNENLLKAIIYAGTARLVKVKLPAAVFDKGLSGAIERDRESKEVKFFEKEGRVFLHPGSLLFTETRFATPFMTYFSKHVTTKPFLRDATEVPLYGILLFGGKVNIELNKGLTIGEDKWVMMRAWPRIGVLVNSLRRLFDADLEANIEDPSFQDSGSPVVRAMLSLLEKDGGMY